MFDFINENAPEELKTIFVISRSIRSYETRFSMVFHIPKSKTSLFGLNLLRYDVLIFGTNFIIHCYIKNLI